MLHLIKLAVGARSPADVADWQRMRSVGREAAVVRTRQFPKRAAELCAGGSLYWVIGGLVSVRQAIVDVQSVRDEDGTRCTAILVERGPVAVMPRPMRAFQGWRYLTAHDAPADLGRETNGLPVELQRRLAELCLL